LLVLIMLVSGNRRIMGERANGPLLATLGWLTTAAMLVAAAASLMTMRS
ncbi:MAG: divalent metal cation transporter, partial [Candidatus Eremiobacteraeota bacterium]|nr:divalent metal cation transporter [Candidatus Eremiobacteraeota bacterium]